MAQPKDYTTGAIAARAWLDKNESFYSGMVSDEILNAIVKAVIDSVDAERTK